MIGGYQVGAYQPFPAFQQEAAETASGGWWPDFEHVRQVRRRKLREIEEAEAETQRLQDETDREIARLLREQEARDAERADLERLQALADRYATRVPDLPKQARIAILNAQDARSRNSLEQMRRVLERVEDEEFAAHLQAVLLMLD